MKILIVADLPNWAIDKLCYPFISKNIDVAYQWDINRFDKIQYNQKIIKIFNNEMLKKYDIIHFWARKKLGELLNNKNFKKKKIIFTLTNEIVIDLWLKNVDYIDKIIAPTKYLFNKFREVHNNIEYIPYGIEIDKYSFGRNKGNKIGYIGRVIPHKRYKELSEVCDPCGVGIIEDKEYWQSISNKGEFNELVPQDQFNDFVKDNFAILVNISEPHTETGPLGILECAALGIPILTLPIGWAGDNLKHLESAYFINDINNLKNDIELLVNNKKLRDKIRINARKIVEKISKQYFEKMRKIYED